MAAATTRTTTGDSAVNIRGTKQFQAVVAMNIGTDDVVTTGDVIPIMELPAEAIITDIKVLSTAIGASMAVDLGIYRADVAKSLDELDMDDDVTVEDVDIYADGITTLADATLTPTSVLGSGSGAVSADDIYKSVRVLAGDTLVSGIMPSKYFLGMKVTVNANPTTGGDVVFIVDYVQA
jgi:uncharacterized hydantoinase/oxoprolinase family protein